MSRATIARILDERDEFVRRNFGKWPNCVEVSQSYADAMARELMLELRWRIPSCGHVHATSRCKLYGMKLKIVSDDKATAQIAFFKEEPKRESYRCGPFEFNWHDFANAYGSMFDHYGNGGAQWRGI